MEKLETVKRLVRQNNYKNNDITYRQCLELGVTVNRVGLEIFARKLRAMDRAEEVSAYSEQSMASSAHNTAPSSSALAFEKSSVVPGKYQDSTSPSEITSNVTPFNKAELYRNTLTTDPTERKREITLELGTIKVREFELLQELNTLEHKHKFAEVY